MSSQDPLQSSSARLHTSAGGAQAPHAPEAQVSVPVDPHEVAQGRVAPAVQAPSSDASGAEPPAPVPPSPLPELDEALVAACPPAPPALVVLAPLAPAPPPPVVVEAWSTLAEHAAARAAESESTKTRRGIFTRGGSPPGAPAVKDPHERAAGGDETGEGGEPFRLDGVAPSSSSTTR